MEDLRQRPLLARERRLGSGLEPVEQREVAIAPQRLDDIPIGVGAVVLEPREQACRRLCVVSERRHLCPQPVEHHVEVARRPEMAAEPAELLPERLGPLAIDERARRAEKCPQPPGRDAELMQVLRIVAAAGTRVVGEERPVVGLERDPERLARRRVLRQLGRSRARRSGRAPGRASASARRSRGRLPCAAPWPAGAAPSRRRRSARPRPRGSAARPAGPRARRRCRRRSRRPGPGPPRGGCGGGRPARARAPRRNAGSRSTSSAGGRAGGPPTSSSSRAASRGSFSCHSPVPSSTRCRNVIPYRARRRSAVSW